MINAFLLFFVIHTTQIGVGIHGFQRIVYMEAKQDAWVSVILIGLASHIIVFFMIKTLETYGSNDLYGIQQAVFGKWIGSLFNIIFVLYVSAAFFTVLRNYIEVVQAWVFPDLETWFISATLLLIVIYAFTGGLRVIVGVSFFSFILAIWLIFFLAYPIEFASVRSLLPLLENKIPAILKGAYAMTFTVIGFEIIYIIYPFVKDKEKVNKYVHLGLLMTTILYLLVMLVSITYFSEEQLTKTIWATLSILSIVRFPFIERFEFIAICFWMLIILPNLCLFVWSAYRGIQRLVKISATKFVWIFSLLIFLLTISIQTRNQINTFNDKMAMVAFYIVFVYPILLYIVAMIKKKFTSNKEQIE